MEEYRVEDKEVTDDSKETVSFRCNRTSGQTHSQRLRQHAQCLNMVKPGRVSVLWRVNGHRLSLQLRRYLQLKLTWKEKKKMRFLHRASLGVLTTLRVSLIASSRWLTQNEFDGIFVKFSSQITLFGNLLLIVLCLYILSPIFMSLYMRGCVCVSYFCFAGLLFVCLLVCLFFKERERKEECGV